MPFRPAAQATSPFTWGGLARREAKLINHGLSRRRSSAPCLPLNRAFGAGEGFWRRGFTQLAFPEGEGGFLPNCLQFGEKTDEVVTCLFLRQNLLYLLWLRSQLYTFQLLLRIGHRTPPA